MLSFKEVIYAWKNTEAICYHKICILFFCWSTNQLANNDRAFSRFTKHQDSWSYKSLLSLSSLFPSEENKKDKCRSTFIDVLSFCQIVHQILFMLNVFSAEWALMSFDEVGRIKYNV